MTCDYRQAINIVREDVLGAPLLSLLNIGAVAECHGILIYLSGASSKMFWWILSVPSEVLM